MRWTFRPAVRRAAWCALGLLLGGCRLSEPDFKASLDRLLEMRDTIGTEVEGYYTPEEMAAGRARAEADMAAVHAVTSGTADTPRGR